MKIKQITRNIFNASKLSSSSDTISFSRGEDVLVNTYDGITIENMNHLEQLIKNLADKTNNVMRTYHPDEEMELGEMKEDSSRALPNTVLFNEWDDGNTFCAYWSVELDFSDGPKKEQVSLTLNSKTLFYLRQESELSKQSLSNVIDQKLSLALGIKDEDDRGNFNELLGSIELIVKKYKKSRT